LAKWYKSYLGEEDDWTSCPICEDVQANWPDDLSDDLYCSDLCPLSVSGWCREYKDDSKLSEEYDDVEGGLTQSELLENYLWWITIELEMRRAEYEGAL